MVLSVMGPVSASSGAAGSIDSTTFEPATATVVSENPFKDAVEGIFLIRLADAPIATYRGGVDGLRATSPRATGLDRVDARSADFQAYDA